MWKLILHGAEPVGYMGREGARKTVWELCGDSKSMKEALLHFWTPVTHRLHPRWVRDAIFWYVLLVGWLSILYHVSCVVLRYMWVLSDVWRLLD